MTTRFLRLAYAPVLVLTLATAAPAQTGLSTISYQGVLSNSGAPVADGAYSLTFKIYSAASGGTPLQTVVVPGVQTFQGRFTALVPITTSNISGADRWWSVTFQGTELAPRQQMTAAPLAIVAGGIADGSQLIVRHDEVDSYAAFINNFNAGGQGLRIRASDGGGTARLLRVDSSAGELRFEVNADGMATVRTLQILGGADLAEPFAASPGPTVEPKPGMVMSIDPAHPGALKVADIGYDSKVAGVYSGANGLPTGMLMGHDRDEQSRIGKDHLPLAMSGRVWVYADEAGGAIEPGDRLTTSDAKPGYAMKVVDKARADGAVIGKAMTKVDQSSGMVLVLVNLQ